VSLCDILKTLGVQPVFATEPLTIAFVSSAFNEEDNLIEFHRRCRDSFELLKSEYENRIPLKFKLFIADNGSEDNTLSILREIFKDDSEVVVLANQRNYGPEPSGVNALQQASAFDLCILLCSDLQDPPEVGIEMARTLLENPEKDAVMAIKKRSSGGPFLRLARRTFYFFLGYSTRLQVVPSGFHGFGCYRRAVVEDSLQLWQHTDQVFRQCLVHSCHSPLLFEYEQAPRTRGVSSYRGWGYWPVALRSLLAGDAAASRLALLIGILGLLLSFIIGLLLLAYFLSGKSGYSAGIPTVMGLVLISSALQMLMFAVLSRQIEVLRMGSLRTKVRFQRLNHDQ
jgi:glycosyltransferase involved in cell wall biosynthesis